MTQLHLTSCDVLRTVGISATLLAGLFGVIAPAHSQQPAPGTFQSNVQGTPGVVGKNSTPGDGVWGEADQGRGVVGVTTSGTGVWGDTQTGRAVVGVVRGQGGTAVWGDTQTGRAVVGVVHGQEGVGVWGENNSANSAAGVFQNDGGGDQINAGTGQAFRVLNNGDVLLTAASVEIFRPSRA